jgi:hypothetical protein
MGKGKGSSGGKSGKGFTSAQAHQKAGTSKFGYTKVNHGNGTFSMKKSNGK